MEYVQVSPVVVQEISGCGHMAVPSASTVSAIPSGRVRYLLDKSAQVLEPERDTVTSALARFAAVTWPVAGFTVPATGAVVEGG